MAEVVGQVPRDKPCPVSGLPFGRECLSHRTDGPFFPAVKEEGSWLSVAQGHRNVGGVSPESQES